MAAKKITVAKINELKDREVKAITTEDDRRILIVKIGKDIKAFGGTCPHYGAPLGDGAHSKERIVCPWHHAEFDLGTGELLEPPACDHLPSYNVKVDGNDIIIEIPGEKPTAEGPQPVGRSTDDERTFVVLGGGAAGCAAVEALRRYKFKGRIVLITQEKDIPYDRPNLSKAYLSGEYGDDSMPLRSKEFYDTHDIELMLDTRVTEADTSASRLTFENGDTLEYDTLLLATGGRPKVPEWKGVDLDNVFTLRSYKNARKIIKAAKKASRAAVIGAGFIGTETAAALSERNIKVTVIAPEKVPFENTLGDDIGRIFREAHTDQGAEMYLGEQVEALEGEGKVERVVLQSGETVNVDMVVIGIGIEPVTDFIKGLDINDDGSITVDKYLRAKGNVFAAGDIARFPFWYTGEDIRIEHWRTALQHGLVAAANMAGTPTAYDSIPFFWTRQAGVNLQYIGYAHDWDDIVVSGNIDEKDFMAFYIKNRKVHAVAGMGRGKQMAAAHEVMRLDTFPQPNQLESGSIDFVKLLGAHSEAQKVEK